MSTTDVDRATGARTALPRPRTAARAEVVPVAAPVARTGARRSAALRTFWVPALLVCTDVAAFGGAVALTAAPTLKTLALLLVTLTVIAANWIADTLYGRLDPRVRRA